MGWERGELVKAKEGGEGQRWFWDGRSVPSFQAAWPSTAGGVWAAQLTSLSLRGLMSGTFKDKEAAAETL